MTDFIEINTNFDSRADALLASPKSSLLVAILLCTYNGARFLGEKLDSLEAQMHQNWVLVASDDGSNDATVDILLQYQAKWPQGKMSIRKGPQNGFCLLYTSDAADE